MIVVLDGERPPPAGAWASSSYRLGDGSHGTCSHASGSQAGGSVDREARRAREGVRLCPLRQLAGIALALAGGLKIAVP
jgi:hypothetical protein